MEIAVNVSNTVTAISDSLGFMSVSIEVTAFKDVML
jgi:AraC-like DNA-binding protein